MSPVDSVLGKYGWEILIVFFDSMQNKSSKPPIQIPLPLAYADSGNWFVPVKRIPIDERTWALRLGAPIQLGTSYDVAKVTGIGRRILKRLAKAGFIHEVRPSPHLSM